MEISVDTFDKICRACLSQSKNMKSLFTKEKDTFLVDLFTCVVNIPTDIDDNLPKQVCVECESILHKVDEFRRRCLESHNLLKNVINSKNIDPNNENKSIADQLSLLVDDLKKDFLEFSTLKTPIKQEIEIEYDNIDCSTNFDENEHLDTSQDENYITKYECDCGQIFHEIDLFQSHKCTTGKINKNKYSKVTNLSEAKIDGIECTQCNQKLKNLAAWKSHIKTHNKKEPRLYQCSCCLRNFKNKRTLTKHIRRQQNNEKIKFTCEKCKRDFKYQAFLESHMISVHMRTDFKCDICEKTLNTKEELESHRDSHKSKKHLCKFCGKAFLMSCTLKDHIRSHTGEKPFLCSTCGKGFSQKNNLVQHTRRHMGFKPFKCDICPKGFVSKGELEAHTRKHSGAHPFVCDDCGNGFTTSSSLVKHRRIHTGERPYACDLCPMKFAASGTLKNHRRTHTGERPFQCSYCDKAFAQRTDLISHIRCHTGERPYVCTQCGLAFRKSANLRTHVKMHGKEVLNGIGQVNMI